METRGFAFVLVILFLLGRVAAQGGATGAITGVVQDKSGGAVAAAKVTAANESTKEVVRSEVTDSSGAFTMTLLPAGNYTVQVTAEDFADTKATGVVVRVTETSRLTISLQLKSVSQSVEVFADVFTIRTTDATTGESLVGSTITSLPLATQNFQQLLSLSAGASSSLNSASQLGRGAVSVNVNGGRDDNNNYQIEGIGANDNSIGELNNTPLPSPDVIQEFKVGTSLYDATQGRNGGGNINAILKTGTANYHADAYEFFRNTVLDANDFFLNRQGLPRPVIKQNIFGVSAGGPVIGGRKLGYFFVNYQGTRQRSGDSPGTFISTVIPVLPLQRDAGSLAAAFSTPATAHCPALTLTASQIDPVAQVLLSVKSNQFGPGTGGGWLIPSVASASGPGVTSTFDPVSNTCSASVNTAPFVVSSPGKFTDNQFTTNWDKEFRGGKDRVSFRFFWTDSEQFQPFGADSFGIMSGGSAASNNLNFPLDIPLRDRFGGISQTHSFSNKLINEFRFGTTIIGYRFANVPIVTAQQLGINRPTNNGTPDIYRFSLAGFQIGPYPTQLQTSLGDTLSYEDTVSYTRAKHTFRFGSEFDRTSLRRVVPVADNGELFFAPTASGTVPTSTPAVSDWQYFLQGQPFLAGASSGLANHDYHIPSLGLFAQDDFRFTQRLTLNLGVRYEDIGAPVDQLCHIGNTDPLLAISSGQPFFYPKCANRLFPALNLTGLTGTAQPSGLNNDWTDIWEPRIGFAYDLGGHHTTSVRGGFGIYSVREDIGAVDNMSFSPPFLPNAARVGVPPLSLANLFVGLIPPLGQTNQPSVPTPSILQGFNVNNSAACTSSGTTTTDTTQVPCFSGNIPGFFGLMVPRRWLSPTLQQWNLTIERSLGHGWVLDVGYIGTHGLHLRETSDRDLATIVSPQNPLTVTAQNGTKFVITQNTVANINARAPFLGLSPSAYEGFIPDANSHYNALQTTLIHRFASGLYLQSAYTWSKSIDDTSTASVATDTRFNNENDPRASRGPSDFDHTHRFVTSFAYEEPFYKDGSGFGGHALRNWTLSGVLTLQAGQPFTAIDSAGGTAAGPSFPNLITPVFSSGFSCANSVAVGDHINGFLKVAAFQPAPVVGPDNSTGYGNVGRNCFRGPWQKNLDFSIGRIFRFGEHQSLKFSSDFFNFTNTPSFASPTLTDIHSAAAGAASFAPLTSTVGTPRLIQFALRYSF